MLLIMQSLPRKKEGKTFQRRFGVFGGGRFGEWFADGGG